MDGIRAIVETTLDRIEQRAYERGRQEKLAETEALPESEPPPISLPSDGDNASVIAALVHHIVQGAPEYVGALTVQVQRVDGAYIVTTGHSGDHLSVTVARQA